MSLPSWLQPALGDTFFTTEGGAVPGEPRRAGCLRDSPIHPSTPFSPRIGQTIGAIDYEMVGRALYEFALILTRHGREVDRLLRAD